MSTVRIQVRRGVSTGSGSWYSVNPTLAAGEIGLETDTGNFKFGNNVDAWNDLPYALADSLADYIPLSQKGVASGIASLDSSGFVPTAQLPPLAKVTVSSVADQTARLALTAEIGDIAIQTDTGASYVLQTAGASTNANWKELVGNEKVQDVIGAMLSGNTETGITVTYEDSDGTIDFVVADQFSTHTTSDLAEGTNLYYTTERAQDAVGEAVGTGLSYNDTTGAISVNTETIQARVANVTDVEIGYLDGVTSAIQTQIDAKSPLTSPTFTGTVSAADLTLSGNLTVNGTTTTVNSTAVNVNNQVIFEGATADAFETTLTTVEPTADRSVSLPDASGSIVLADNTEILSNKTINFNANTLTATIAQLNTAVSDADLATLVGVETLTNKTLTSPKINEEVALTATSTELNVLDGITSSTAELNILDGVTSSTAELNTLDGITATTAELNILDGVVASTAEINKLAGVTATSAEINTLTGITSTAAELNILDGATLSVTELNYVDGVTSAIQTQLNNKQAVVADVSDTEIGYLNGVTSAIQTQIDAKAPLASPTFTGTVTLPANTISQVHISDDSIGTNEIGGLAVTTEKIADSAVTSAKIATGTIVNEDINSSAAIDWTKLAISSTVSAIEAGYLDGVTGAIQTQLDGKQATVANVSDVEIGYLDGVTSSIQTQLDAKSTASKTETLTNKTLTSPVINTPTGITKSDVGLGNVDNTADSNKPVSTATQTALDLKLALAGGTMTGAITLHADPSSSLHAATKQYVDNTASGVIAKPQVLGATTANIDATYSNGTAGVGATLTHNTNGVFPAESGGASGWAVGKGILVKNQTNKAQNGRYYVSNMGSVSTPYVLTRCTYCDEASEIPGAYIFVQDGTNAGTGWIQVVADPATFVVGTDNIDVFQFSGSGTITAGTNISVSGNEISVVATPSLSGVAFTDGTQTKEGVPSRTPIIQKTAAYTLSALTERDSLIEVSSATGVTISIPTDATLNYPIGTSIDILQTGAGQVTIAAVTPGTTTVNSTPGLKLRTQWSTATLFKRAANTWVVYGDLTA
jgi:hypothetical protein